MSSTISHAAKPGELTQEVPTLKCLGVRWLISGDGNANARIAVDYRPVGLETWKRGLDLFRVETAGIREPNRPPAGQTLFAGSIFDLQEDTEYEVKLSLHDPDGGNTERILRMKTWTEPRLAPDAPQVDVYPGQLAEALAQAQPGQVLRLHAGVYQGTFQPRSGAPGQPIGIVGAGDGAAILDGRGANNVINASGLHDVIFQNLTFQNARWAIAVNGGANLVIRRCVIRDSQSISVVHRNIAEFGGDPKRIFVGGHSAGAQLAALICIDVRYVMEEGVSFDVLKGCVPVDGDTYDIPKIIMTAEHRQALYRGKRFTFGHRQKFGNNPEKHVDFSAVTHVAKNKGIPPFLILYFSGNPDTSAPARRLEAVLKEADIPVTAYGKRDSNHSRLNDDLGKPDDPATRELYKFLDALSRRHR